MLRMKEVKVFPEESRNRVGSGSGPTMEVSRPLDNPFLRHDRIRACHRASEWLKWGTREAENLDMLWTVPFSLGRRRGPSILAVSWSSSRDAGRIIVHEVFL